MSRKNKKVRMSSRIDLADALRKESSLSAFTFDGPYRLTGHDLLDNMYCADNGRWYETPVDWYPWGMEAFKKAGYVPYKGLDSYNQRGILYMVRKDYLVKAIHMLENPHMMHIQIEKEGKKVDIITIRILVSGSDDADYISRKEQWNKILKYIDTLENKENLCLTGDFNHGVISEEYKEDQARQYFNYQMIVNSLKEKNISLASIDGMSYKGYMKIDHLCTSENLNVLDAAYVDVFGEHRIIGVPDHSMIVARIEVA